MGRRRIDGSSDWVDAGHEFKANLRRYRQPGVIEFQNGNTTNLDKFIFAEKGCHIPNKGVLNFLLLHSTSKLMIAVPEYSKVRRPLHPDWLHQNKFQSPHFDLMYPPVLGPHNTEDI